MKLPAFKSAGLWKTIKPTFANNSGLKVFSLACAIALYAFVHGAQDAQRIIAVDLVVLLPPASQNRTLTTDLPTSVRVSLHGPRSMVADLRPADLGSVQLDLRSGRSGTLPLEPGMLSVPGGVTIDSIEPQSLQIAWDDVIEREITLQIPITGAPADGFVIKGRPTATPANLHARGPSQVVESLQLARTEALDVTGLKAGEVRLSLAIDRPPPRTTYDISYAVASVEIIAKLGERMFSKVHVEVVGDARVTALPPRVDVRVAGPPDLIEALRPEQIVPRVNLQDADVNLKKPNSVALPVELELDEMQVTIIPKSVVVKW